MQNEMAAGWARRCGGESRPRGLPAPEGRAVVVAGLGEEQPLSELYDRHGISEGDHQAWKDEAVAAAAAITAAQARTSAPTSV